MDFLTQEFVLGPIQVVPWHLLYLITLFLFLVWVMKQFLFAPLVRIMDTRSARIREAEKAERDAAEQVEEGMKKYREAIQQARRRAFEVREEATREAEGERDKMLGKARKYAGCRIWRRFA